MKLSFPSDTSALISLGHSELIEKVLEEYIPIVTLSVISELIDIATGNDPDSESAKRWLEERHRFKIQNVETQIPTEKELYDISLQKGLPLVIDDIKATKKYQKRCKCLFSVHIIYGLFYKGKITKVQALLAIQKMRKKRYWKDNAISVAGRVLFED